MVARNRPVLGEGPLRPRKDARIAPPAMRSATACPAGVLPPLKLARSSSRLVPDSAQFLGPIGVSAVKLVPGPQKRLSADRRSIQGSYFEKKLCVRVFQKRRQLAIVELPIGTCLSTDCEERGTE
jgi:hypothetical protein